MQLDEEQKTELERRLKRSAAAQRVFNCPDGELVLDEIKMFCNAETFIFDQNHSDPTSLAVKVGKRDVYQCIQNMLTADIGKARKMLEGQKKEEAQDKEGQKTE